MVPSLSKALVIDASSSSSSFSWGVSIQHQAPVSPYELVKRGRNMHMKGSPKQYSKNFGMRCDDVFCMTISRNRVSAITVVQRTLLSSKRLRGGRRRDTELRSQSRSYGVSHGVTESVMELRSQSACSLPRLPLSRRSPHDHCLSCAKPAHLRITEEITYAVPEIAHRQPEYKPQGELS